jgi:hypothetical protein
MGALLFIGAVAESHAECLMNEAGYANISGEYFGVYPASQIVGGVGWIYQKGNTLIIDNDSQTPTAGNITQLNISVPGWSLTGTLANNCGEILWSNGWAWVRK